MSLVQPLEPVILRSLGVDRKSVVGISVEDQVWDSHLSLSNWLRHLSERFGTAFADPRPIPYLYW